MFFSFVIGVTVRSAQYLKESDRLGIRYFLGFGDMYLHQVRKTHRLKTFPIRFFSGNVTETLPNKYRNKR